MAVYRVLLPVVFVLAIATLGTAFFAKLGAAHHPDPATGRTFFITVGKYPGLELYVKPWIGELYLGFLFAGVSAAAVFIATGLMARWLGRKK